MVFGINGELKGLIETRVNSFFKREINEYSFFDRISEFCFSSTISVLSLIFLFFFSSRRRHTRLVSDWSSDVCSSDRRRRHTRLVSDWSSDVCSSDLRRVLFRAIR